MRNDVASYRERTLRRLAHLPCRQIGTGAWAVPHEPLLAGAESLTAGQFRLLSLLLWLI